MILLPAEVPLRALIPRPPINRSGALLVWALGSQKMNSALVCRKMLLVWSTIEAFRKKVTHTP